MKLLLCVVILCVGFTFAHRSRYECILRSRNPDGTPAHCGGIAGAMCPNPTDTCRFYPTSDYGPCCLGCKFGYPLPGYRCGGWGGRRCPFGYRCVYDPYIADLPGMCCWKGHHYG